MEKDSLIKKGHTYMSIACQDTSTVHNGDIYTQVSVDSPYVMLILIILSFFGVVFLAKSLGINSTNNSIANDLSNNLTSNNTIFNETIFNFVSFPHFVLLFIIIIYLIQILLLLTMIINTNNDYIYKIRKKRIKELAQR